MPSAHALGIGLDFDAECIGHPLEKYLTFEENGSKSVSIDHEAEMRRSGVTADGRSACRKRWRTLPVERREWLVFAHNLRADESFEDDRAPGERRRIAEKLDHADEAAGLRLPPGD